MALPPPSVHELAFGVKFWADFIREALAAIAGAGVGAWLGARFAFSHERTKAAADRQQAATAAATELAERRATSGNLAVFTLAQIYNDLVVYEQQLMAPARKSPAPWFHLMPAVTTEDNFYRFDVPSLAFLLQSKRPGAPSLLMKLAMEQDRYAGFLDTLRRRADFHEQHIPPIIERLQTENPPDRKWTDLDLQQAVGPRIYATLRNQFADIEELLRLGLQTSKQTGVELRTFLVAELPGQTIIGFELGEEISPGGSPQMRARNRAAAAGPQG
jgi:hypothetical protein